MIWKIYSVTHFEIEKNSLNFLVYVDLFNTQRTHSEKTLLFIINGKLKKLSRFLNLISIGMYDV